MLSRYKKSVSRLLIALREVEKNPADLRIFILGALQTATYRVLCRVEKARNRLKHRARELKAEKRHGRLPKKESTKLKRRIETLNSHVSEYEKTIYLLRAIGDGIAFSLFDKWDFKPLHFKQDAGQLSGKLGSKLERKILRRILADGVPAVHCDITNVIRYGDICVRINSFPFLVEVKSSKNTNERVERQIESIQHIHNYYGTDEIEGLYGTPKTIRASPSTKEVEYSDELNMLIDESHEDSCVWRMVEPGLAYIIVREFEDSVFDKITREALINACFPVLCRPHGQLFQG